MAGEPISVLDGEPVAIKDEIDCLPYPTTGGTKWLHKERPCKDDSCCVKRLRQCGAILVEKTNMHELGSGTSGINPHYGPNRKVLLEESAMDLVLSLLNSDKLKLEQKLEVVEWLFIDEGDSHSGLDGPTIADCNFTLVNEIFSSSCEGISRSRVLILGRVVVFISFLKYSFKLDEDVRVVIVQKLNWFLDILVEENVYSHMLVLHLPLFSGYGKTAELVCHPMFTLLLQ